MILKSKKQAHENGFTLMEVLIAITILSVGMIGSISLINSNISNTANAINKIIAANLAQEGIEMVRNVRDTNFLKIINGDASVSWDDILMQNEGDPKPAIGTKRQLKFFCGNAANDPGYPHVNSAPADINACGNACKIVIYGKTAAPAFDCYSDDFGSPYSVGDKSANTIFYRLITVEKIDDVSTLAKVVVKWTARGYTQTLTVTEKLYDWK